MENRGRFAKYVDQYVGLNQRAKRINGEYCLFDVFESEDGKPIERYVGRITPDGLIEEAPLTFGSFVLYEYGASKTLHDLYMGCATAPYSTKVQRLRAVVFKKSPNSYLFLREPYTCKEKSHLIKMRMDRLLEEHYGTSIDKIYSVLGTIYLLVDVNTWEKQLSRPNDNQLDFLSKLGVSLEVIG